jgi:hypothetical protein
MVSERTWGARVVRFEPTREVPASMSSRGVTCPAHRAHTTMSRVHACSDECERLCQLWGGKSAGSV